MSPSRLALVLLFAMFSISQLAVPVSAQFPSASDTTSPPTPGAGHDYIGEPSETVNPANGSVSIRIPVRVPSGRQLTLPFSFAYDSAGAFYYGQTAGAPPPHWATITGANFSQGGWSYTLPQLTHSQEDWLYQGPTKNFGCQGGTNYVFQDPTGNRHNLGLAPVMTPIGAQCGGGYDQGGEGPIVATTQDGLPGCCKPVTVTDGNGTTYSFSGHAAAFPTTVTDRNGNTISISYTTSATVTDTLGRTAISLPTFGSNPDNISVAGLSSPYQVSWTTASANFTINAVNLPGNTPCPTSMSGSVKAVSQVLLPNGQKFTLAYDGTYGMLNKMTYPTGGYVRYVWGLAPQEQFFTGAEYDSNGYTTATFACIIDYPAVTDRYVSFDGTTEVLHQHFAYSTSWQSGSGNWTSKTTTLTTTDEVRNTSFTTVYSYTPIYAPCVPDPNPNANDDGCVSDNNFQQMPVEQCIEYYDASGSGGTPPSPCPNLSPSGKLLRTEIKSWYNNDPRTLGSVQTVLDNGQSSLVVNCYNVNEQLTETDSYDLGTSAVTLPGCANNVPSGTVAGGLLRKTTKTYATFAAGYNIVDLPSAVITYDGSGNRVAETDTSYDQTGGSNRGNPTTITKQCFNISGGAACPQGNSSTIFTYDSNGQMLTMKDPKGNTTSYSYTDSYSSCGGHAPPTSPSDAYLTQITYPQTNGVNHIVSFCYDYTSGLMLSSTDENNLTTTYTFADSLDRLTKTSYPDGGQTTISYNDTPPTPTVTTSKKINSSGLTVTSTAVQDGLGHVTETQLTTDPQGTIYNDTAYDGLGRAYTVSNPHRSGNDPTTSAGTTTYVYDALGRKASVTYPDSSVLTTAYCGPSTLATDPVGKWRRSRTDGLGRLVEVDEPNAVGATVNSNGCPGQSDPIWVTSYTLNALGALTQVVQNSSHTRTFTYDSLSHLLTSNNPEVGTITYTYDADGNVATKQDARSITSTYAYDALNRETSTTYSNSDPTITTTYDQSGCLGLSACQNIGHATSITDGAGSEAWAYQVDSANQRSVHVNQRTTSSITKTSTYYFDLAGNLTSITYPTGRVVNYTYDAANRPQTAVDSANGITYAGAQSSPPTGCPSTGVCYTPEGTEYSAAVGKTSSFNGVNLSETYNTRLQPLEIKAGPSSGNVIDITYSFVDSGTGKNAGHVNSITNNLNSSRTQSFSYDQVNRILTAGTTATSGTYCWGYQYNYDAWGNLLAQAGWSPNYNGCTEATMGSVNADGNNHISGLTYDASGNTTNDGTIAYTYDAESQIKTAAGVTYTYDGSGRRVSKSNGKLYWYGSGGEILAETDSSGNTLNEYIFFGGKRIAVVSATAGESLPIQNSSFEIAGPWTYQGCNGTCFWNGGPIPDWTISGGLGGGSFQPGPTYYTLPLPDGNVVAWSNASNISQTLTGIGLQPNTTYTLSVYIGHRSDNLATTYSVSLQAGSTTLNTVSGSNSTIPLGQFAKVTLTYTTGSTVTPGDLSIVLGSGGQQIDFDAVSLTTSGGVYYYVEDLLGSSRVMTTAGGAVCYDGDFDPYGGEHTYTDTCPQNYKFEGKERDTETGNDDFGARYYSNRFGRWLSADWSSVPVAIPYANLTNPQTLNLYSMVADDPESFADLDGHCGQVVLPGAPPAACTNPPNNTPPATGEGSGNPGTGESSSAETADQAQQQATQNGSLTVTQTDTNPGTGLGNSVESGVTMKFSLETNEKLSEGPATLSATLLDDKGKPVKGDKDADLGPSVKGDVELVQVKVLNKTTEHTKVNVELKPVSPTQDFGISNRSGRLQFQITDAKGKTFTGETKVSVARPDKDRFAGAPGLTRPGSLHNRDVSPVSGRTTFNVKY